VLGGVGHGEPHQPRQLLHAALTLGQELQDLQPVAAAHRLGDARELAEQLMFEISG